MDDPTIEDRDLAVVSVRGRRRRLLRDRSFLAGAAVISLVTALAVAAPHLGLADPNQQFRDVLASDGRPAGISWRFVLGTDALFHDELSRLIHGARATLLVGLLGSGLAITGGLVAGVIAATASMLTVSLPLGLALRIPVESLVLRSVDVALAFPGLLLAIVLGALLGPSVALTVAIITFLLWAPDTRILHARARQVWASPWIEATQAMGIGRRRLLLRHVSPHLLPTALTYAALGFAGAILIEATLAFIGVGVPPSTPTWGRMLADHISWYRTDPRLVLIPGLAITSTVLAFSLVADAFRDALDPRSQEHGAT
jgi:peptide/nickel transport system permease protein